jgi:glycosyltransferase involved in cell wall biosynthesis
MDKISIIIPTYNRFNYLLNAINSVQNQTYKNIEIIVINDCSTQTQYYNYNFGDNVKIIHLKENSKNIFGYACAGYVRNEGIKVSEGKYIAFLDDDDIWFPNKLELQIKGMEENGVKMSCTDGLCGNGFYNSENINEIMMMEKYFDIFKNVYKIEGEDMLNNGYPKIWNKKLITIRNLCICSSVIIEKEILTKINIMKCVKNGEEDYDCWLRALDYTNCIFIDKPLIYYDMGHGDGQNY